MKYNVNLLNSLFIGIVFFLVSAGSYTQHYNDPKDAFYPDLNVNVNNPAEDQQESDLEQDARVTELAKQMTEAKQTENISRLRELEAEMNRLTGSVSTRFVNDPSVTGMLRTEEYYPESGDGISTIANGPFWAIATQTSSRSGNIYAAVTEYFEAAGDRLKIYVSYDHGVTWVLKCTFSGFVNGVRYRPEELDIEPVISGTDTLVYAVAGYSFNSSTLTQIAKCNIVTNSITTQSFSFTTTASICYNPRIVSDNANYLASTYLYITVSNDSTINVNNHNIKARLCVILNPFAASFTQTHRNPGPNSAFWWHQLGVPADTYLYQDVGFFHNTPDNTDVIYVTTIFPGLNALYNAWSKTYGVSNSGNMSIPEGFPVSKVRLAFNGGTNQDGAIVYLRQATSNPNGNIDVMVQNTNSGGFLPASWIGTYVDASSDTATSCDIQAVKLAPNKFKFAYSVKGGKCYYSSNTSRTTYTLRTLVNNLPAGDGFGRVRAGYRVTADSCLSVWSGNTGTNFYSTYGCDGFVGITQSSNEVPAEFRLLQNYPNPFNPVTNIKFSIPKASFVKLVVCDVTGKQVAELVNRHMNAGFYTQDFDASHLASGVYFYRVTADNFTDVKKMILIK
jgi:hypothetical protein